MSQPSSKFYVPPFASIRLYECRDQLFLVPVPSYREFFAYGKVKATEAVIELEDGTTEPFWDDCTPDEEVWAVVQWTLYEDGHKERGTIQYLRAPKTEQDAREAMRRMEEFYGASKEELLALVRIFRSTEDDEAYIESRHPNFQVQPTREEVDKFQLYQARLKVLAGMNPKTVALMQKANDTKDPVERELIEREAVEAYFAEVATYWTDDMIKGWQRTNPVGSEWMCEFAKVMEEPERQMDPINHELALNWLRRGYNLMTENELSDAILIATGQRLIPNTLKKKRANLGLTARRPGPKFKSEQ